MTTNQHNTSTCPPALQWRQCTRKVRHASQRQALAELVRLWLDGRGTYLHVYACRLAPPLHWHVGHNGLGSATKDDR